jgi:hypothetical protein
VEFLGPPTAAGGKKFAAKKMLAYAENSAESAGTLIPG